MTKTKLYARPKWLLAQTIFGLILLCCTVLAGCKEKNDGRLLSAIDDEEVYNDKSGRYKSMEFMVFGYVDYPIFNISILPMDKSELAYSVRAPAISPELEKNKWGGQAAGDDFVWDRTWKTPKQFKVWWQRIVDPRAWDMATSYDRYTNLESQPGSAWCEAIVTISKPLPKEPRYFTLHFYPDGHVEAYISELKEIEAERPRVEYKDRLSLATLQGKSCIKEIRNPYYGLARPVQLN